MAKPPKGPRAGQASATDADHEQQGGELPQEPTSNATDTPQPDADAGSGQDPHAGTGEGDESDSDHHAAGQAPGDAAGAVTTPLTGDQSAGATDADREQQSGDEPDPLPDERVLVRFPGPWKNYSRGDITRLSPAEAELVFKKALAQDEPEQAEE
ncbi:hypothetical protein EHZ47_09190 [Aeromonas jandaei]|uniref:hypothetical protein n=1 Tax=Aeromonas jandaei TaxID=650 RepID=UPI000F536152|nr:hypothetical protein [Aeromonas jandaei]RQM76217.1 hypothetical protein EHZ47_09190 [Aeromonas jandaei]